jgi:hypothetical protein
LPSEKNKYILVFEYFYIVRYSLKRNIMTNFKKLFLGLALLSLGTAETRTSFDLLDTLKAKTSKLVILGGASLLCNEFVSLITSYTTFKDIISNKNFAIGSLVAVAGMVIGSNLDKNNTSDVLAKEFATCIGSVAGGLIDHAQGDKSTAAGFALKASIVYFIANQINKFRSPNAQVTELEKNVTEKQTALQEAQAEYKKAQQVRDMQQECVVNRF